MDKLCTRCETLKDLGDFPKRKDSKDGYNTRCKICIAEVNAARYQANREDRQKVSSERYYRNKEAIQKKKKETYDANAEFYRKVSRDYGKSDRGRYARRINKLKVVYNLSDIQYRGLMDNQAGVCPICKKSLDHLGYDKSIMVDHDHRTGKVRGLLCGLCNSMLGFAEDSIETLENAVDFLKTGGDCGS